MMVSNSKFYIKSTITSTQADGTTFLLSPDFELSTNLETAGASVSMVLKSGTQIERFEISATGGVATIVKRGLTQSGTETESVGLQKQWTDGTIAYVTALAFDIFDKQGDTMTGNLAFSGTTFAGVKVNNLTTAQRTALTPTNGEIVYDTNLQEFYSGKNGAWTPLGTGSGGGAIWSKDSTDDSTLTGAINGSNVAYTLSTTPGSVNSTFVYLNGQLMERTQDYNLSGTTLTFTFAPTSGKIVVIYPDVAPGVDTASTRATTNANALNGELYRSTDDSQSLYYKDNGGDSIKIYDVTTNQLFVNVTGFTAKTSLVDADQVLISDSAASNVDKKITYANIKTQLVTDKPVSTSAPGFATMATDVIATAGTDQTTYINPKQAKDNYLLLTSSSVGLYPIIDVNAGGAGFPSSGTYTKVKEIAVGFSGAIFTRLTVTGSSSGGAGNMYGRIYKNGVAIGTERSQSLNTSGSATYDESFTSVTSGDLIQLYTKTDTTGLAGSFSNFILGYYPVRVRSTVNL